MRRFIVPGLLPASAIAAAQPARPLIVSSVCIPLRTDLQGFVMAPNGSVDFEGVRR